MHENQGLLPHLSSWAADSKLFGFGPMVWQTFARLDVCSRPIQASKFIRKYLRNTSSKSAVVVVVLFLGGNELRHSGLVAGLRVLDLAFAPPGLTKGVV